VVEDEFWAGEFGEKLREILGGNLEGGELAGSRLLAGFAGNFGQAGELGGVGFFEDRAVRGEKSEIFDAEFGEFLGEEFGFVSAVGQGLENVDIGGKFGRGSLALDAGLGLVAGQDSSVASKNWRSLGVSCWMVRVVPGRRRRTLRRWWSRSGSRRVSVSPLSWAWVMKRRLGIGAEGRKFEKIGGKFGGILWKWEKNSREKKSRAGRGFSRKIKKLGGRKN